MPAIFFIRKLLNNLSWPWKRPFETFVLRKTLRVFYWQSSFWEICGCIITQYIHLHSQNMRAGVIYFFTLFPQNCQNSNSIQNYMDA
jgi:hypothetical protein